MTTSRNREVNKLRVLNTIAFVAFCYFVGSAAAISLTCLIFDLNTAQLSDILRYSQISNRPVIITQALIFTVSGFMIFPTVYRSITGGKSVSVLRRSRLHFGLLLTTIVLAFSTLPLVSVLIEFNYNIPFPNRLWELGTYFKEMEDASRRLTGSLLTFSNLNDLAIAIMVIAIIPGFAEEYFFRGLVQTQLQNILKNHHYAILLSAFLFSLMHFQFHGLIPRMAWGILFGYLFVWSNNLWYPIIAHMINNSVGVLLSYFWGPAILEPGAGNRLPIIWLMVSLAVFFITMRYLRKNYATAQEATS